MLKGTELRWHAQIIFAGIAMVAFLAAAESLAAAQQQKRQFQPGEMVQVSENEIFKIFQCRGTGDDEDCEIIVYDKSNQPTTRKMWIRAYSIRGSEARFKEANEVGAAKERLAVKQKAGTFATTAQPKFQPGEYIDTGGGYIYELLECRGAGENAQCKVQAYSDGGAANVQTWQYVSDMRAAVQRVQYAKKQEAGERRTTPNTGGGNTNPKQPTQNDGSTTGQAAAECSYEPPAPQHSNSAGFSVSLAKREIFDTAGWSANGTVSAPLRVGVVFLSFQAGKPHKNIVRITARGAERLNDAAPPNTMLYPIKSKYIVCEEFRGEVRRSQVEGEYDCHKTKEGEWVCTSKGRKTTPLN